MPGAIILNHLHLLEHLGLTGLLNLRFLCHLCLHPHHDHLLNFSFSFAESMEVHFHYHLDPSFSPVNNNKK